jgi:hypothetical protein
MVCFERLPSNVADECFRLATVEATEPHESRLALPNFRARQNHLRGAAQAIRVLAGVDRIEQELLRVVGHARSSLRRDNVPIAVSFSRKKVNPPAIAQQAFGQWSPPRLVATSIAPWLKKDN